MNLKKTAITAQFSGQNIVNSHIFSCVRQSERGATINFCG